jgi:hypothetical protein
MPVRTRSFIPLANPRLLLAHAVHVRARTRGQKRVHDVGYAVRQCVWPVGTQAQYHHLALPSNGPSCTSVPRCPKTSIRK